ncbi:MAG: sigma 54-interacting transcriptional regulator [Bacteroidota bacterium]
MIHETIHTLGDLRKSGYGLESIKDEMRRNVIAKLRRREVLFPGIVGFEETVIPQIVNAVLARHDILLLGLRGQAKTRIARMLVNLLDEYVPIVKDSEINDHPLAPVSQHAVEMVREFGDLTPIEWIHRSERYGEKLATPDVTVADLIGDIDPIKAATKRLHYSHEGAIHFGIIPRTNRGIFVINELPDLQPRIQVGLFNILQERDIQIRGFNVRMALDVLMVFTANPEDYTNRGSIITPLKDRIEAQILTHYPKSLEDAMTITEQEAWSQRDENSQLIMPKYFREIVENIAFLARTSEFVDQSSGVSARLTIATMEAMISNAERRAILTDENVILPRIIDLAQAVTGITGKIELVFEGEQEGPLKVSKALVGKAVREVFKKYFPDPLLKMKRQKDGPMPKSDYDEVLQWFEKGNTITLSDTMHVDEFLKELSKVPGLKELAEKHMKLDGANAGELASAMEFVVDGLHQNSKIAKDDSTPAITYKDMVGSIFTRPGKSAFEDEDDDEGGGFYR